MFELGGGVHRGLSPVGCIEMRANYYYAQIIIICHHKINDVCTRLTVRGFQKFAKYFRAFFIEVFTY